MTIKTTIIKDSISPDGNRLTTFELRYPRIIHSEFMTHRMFSRNASSSRAIPITRIIEDVISDPAFPSAWGLNGKGMQDHGKMSETGIAEAKALWLQGRDYAVEVARKMLELKEVPHKQIVNRLLESYSHINVVVTATNYDNFFWLRRHEDADPTIYELADKMWNEYKNSTPKQIGYGEWHLPYTSQEDIDLAAKYILSKNLEITKETMLEAYITMSVARCARVSYKTRDNKTPSVQQDAELYATLLESEPLHASPAEHQATPDRRFWFGWEFGHQNGNFTGWRQYRKMLKNEYNKNYKGD